MADLRDLSAQLLAAAPLTPGLGAVVQGDPSEFLLQFEDGTEMRVESDPATGRAVVAVLLGQPSARTLVETLSAMLAYNAVWRTTGGAWIAREGPEGPLLLLADLEESDEPESLAILLGNLVTIGEGWRTFMARDGQAEPPLFAMPSAAMIRG
jgi:hypothetical protein